MSGQSLADYAEERAALPPEAMRTVEEPVGPVVEPEPPKVLRALLPVAVVISCGLHAAAAAALLISTTALPEYGVLNKDTDALSLETAQTIVVESTMSEPVDTAAAAAAAMPQGAVAADDLEPELLAAVDELPLEKAVAPSTIEAAEVSPQAAEEPLEVLRGAAEPAESVTAKAPEQKRYATREARRKRQRKEAQKERTSRQTAGGPTSRSNAAKGAASGRASASRGSILSYAARVRAKVVRNKPSSSGHRGTAQVAFGVSSSGSLSYARLARSSGSVALDQAALSAVRRAAPFGAPPAGASSGQLRFSIPFYFR